jgi:hypothetical protein
MDRDIESAARTGVQQQKQKTAPDSKEIAMKYTAG